MASHGACAQGPQRLTPASDTVCRRAAAGEVEEGLAGMLRANFGRGTPLSPPPRFPPDPSEETPLSPPPRFLPDASDEAYFITDDARIGELGADDEDRCSLPATPEQPLADAEPPGTSHREPKKARVREDLDASVGSQPAVAGAGLYVEFGGHQPAKKAKSSGAEEPMPPPPPTKQSARIMKMARPQVSKQPPPPPPPLARRGKKTAPGRIKLLKHDPIVDCMYCKMAVRASARARAHRALHTLSPPRRTRACARRSGAQTSRSTGPVTCTWRVSGRRGSRREPMTRRAWRSGALGALPAASS